MLSATNVDILVNATEREGNQVKQPPKPIEEKVAFLVNNLSQTNLTKKASLQAVSNCLCESLRRKKCES